MRDFLSDLPIVGDFMAQRPKVAVIRLSGVIADAQMRRGAVCAARYAELIEKAFAVRDLREVAIVVNSPGGAPAQASLIAGLIRHCAADKKMPVTAFVEDVAASGGYWLACAADKIYVQPASIVGSIGVIAAGFGFEDFIRRHDIKRRVHTAGTSKAMLDPFLPEKKNDVQRLESLQKEIHAQFIAWVRERRGNRLKGTEADLFEGQIWTGAGAVANGLADAVGDLRGVMHDKYGDKVRLMPFEPERGFVSSLLGTRAGRGGIAAEAMDAIEARGAWQRFGL
ncbi:MAG: S49 family peptidase [Rhodospirillales bacterium]|nr:S49 family peptidase [Alphaproteobacteria bacterium]MCB9987228.1 S49 family peptidase [Rhodospirillales bacterium]USO07911.1 MAG: S49 family peptidase [Rhodospirillales bacterium]